jgi:maltose alpha-D-glucosyltransferase/alpha-amylase
MKLLQPKDTLWYKDAVIYEAHVKAYFDSTNDGIGDFPGFTSKLDYLQDLGINCVWLLPFYPSPLKDDGYDISDFLDVHSLYGKLHDFKVLVREAHRRGIRVITELVLNHTSDQHPWFQAARKAPKDSTTRNLYVWSDTAKKYENVRIIFSDTEPSNWTWDPVAEQYYWHRFFHHQPDINYDNPAALRKVMEVLRFWLDLGVDGMRLDAVPYLVEREGTEGANLPETHAILKEIRRQIDLNYPDRMLLAEANLWPPDVVQYFGQGDECHMAFHFPLMPRIYMALRQEDRHPITDIFRQTPEIPENCQWALFLRNHDELTLEMVTDEERDYMYNAYAADSRSRLNLGIRRRLAPLMENSRRRIELLISILFSLRGTPCIYYGDEIGMGDNIYLGDRNGVRTPMQWSNDRNAGFSCADFAQLYSAPIMDPVYGYQAINVEAQERDPSSLLNWMKRMIALRKGYKTFGRGTIEFLYPLNRKVLAYIRRYQDEAILCVANLSRFVQPVELDLQAWKGYIPIEMIGRNHFPQITESHYFLTLGPHNFFWFQLTRVPEIPGAFPQPMVIEEEALPVLTLNGSTADFLQQNQRILENQVLPLFLRKQVWFRGQKRKIQDVSINDAVVVDGDPALFVLFVEVRLGRGEVETYVLPVCLSRNQQPACAQPLAKVRKSELDLVLCDALSGEVCAREFLNWIQKTSQVKTQNGELNLNIHEVEAGIHPLAIDDPQREHYQFLGTHPDRTMIGFGTHLMLKIYRQLTPGPSEEQEVLPFLLSKGFDRVPHLLGVLEYKSNDKTPNTILLAERLVSHQGNVWDYTLDELGRFFERARSARQDICSPSETASIFEFLGKTPSAAVADVIGSFMHTASLLGRRTAEFHLTLASDDSSPRFKPQIFSSSDYDELVQRVSTGAEDSFQELFSALKKLKRSTRTTAHKVLRSRRSLLKQFENVRKWDERLLRIRVHSNYDLGKLLWVKYDFLFMDFEKDNNSNQNHSEFESPIQDVASMMRSFSYAAYTALMRFTETRMEDYEKLKQWSVCWERWVCAAFLTEYFSMVANTKFIPSQPDQIKKFINLHLAEQMFSELKFELSSRQDWVRAPLEGLLSLQGRSTQPKEEAQEAKEDYD